MNSRVIALVLLGAAFGSLMLVFGADPRTWFSFSIVAFLAAVLLTVFEEDRSPLVIVISLVYAGLASWVFFTNFLID